MGYVIFAFCCVALILQKKKFCTVSKWIVNSLLIHHYNISCFITLSLLPESFQNLHLQTFCVAENCKPELGFFLSI